LIVPPSHQCYFSVMINSKKKFAVVVGLLLVPLTASAHRSFDTLSFKPANDHGYYLTVEQSQTLGHGGYAIGVTGDYSDSAFDLHTNAGELPHVISKQAALHLGAALGLNDWLNIGANISGSPYQQFINPVTLAPDKGMRMGDVLVNAKIRLADNDDSPIGIALVPFMTIPTGDSGHFTGNSDFTGGGKLVLDTMRIADRVSFAVNAGGHFRPSSAVTAGQSTVGSQLLYGGALNVAVAEPVHLIAELNGSTEFSDLFGSQHTDLEADGAVRLLPGEKRRVSLTAGGGVGITHRNAIFGSGAGGSQVDASSPDWRVFATLAYRFSPGKKSEPEARAVTPAPLPVAEEVITVNKIHFAFNKSTIRTDSTSLLNDILEQIRGRSKVEWVRIEGHTDQIGSDEFNQKLSEERANAVREFFVEHGYPADQVTAVGKGEMSPVANNSTTAGRGQNRRVEFHLHIKPGSNTRVEKKDNSSSELEEDALSKTRSLRDKK
ncbi:MAG: OmpA family protein, partial [Deltaproteobacteria bacterium]|nr:OmpA family protein [Deltaproteobacteria bacterium]